MSSEPQTMKVGAADLAEAVVEVVVEQRVQRVEETGGRRRT